MKISWNKVIHSGWRRALGLGLIVFGIVSAGFYYTEMRVIGRAFQNQSQVVVVPSMPAVELTEASTVDPKELETPVSQSGKIKLNSATQAELETLPQIGPAKANAIIEYRAQRPFRSIEELDNVKGIGPKTMEQLRPLIEL
jgi:comEA protein